MNRKRRRVLLDDIEGEPNARKKLITEAGFSLFIPVHCGRQIPDRTRTQDELSQVLRFRIWSAASFQVRPSV